MIQALTLILAGMQLLLTINTSPVMIPEPLRTQAITVANQAIKVGNEEYSKALQIPTGSVSQPAPTQTQPLITQPKTSMQSIKIISPMSNKGLGRQYKTSPEIVDESNYIVLGLVCRNNAGDIDKDSTVTVVATDTTQNKTLVGTGDLTKIYNNGVANTVHYYPFHYEFKTAGKHTITFTCNGLSESVELEVSA